MAKSVRITLDEPLVGHGDPIRVVVVREPRAGDVLDLGDPIVIARTDADALVTIENDEKIRRYIERLTQDESGKSIDPAILAQGSVADVLRLRDVVIGFFSEARAQASKLRSD